MTSRSRTRIARRFVVLVVAVALIALIGYIGFGVVVASDWFVHPTGSTDCRTPLDRYGWSYEAINYDIADDAHLRANRDMQACGNQGTVAGSAVVTSDRVPIAGWYVPAAGGGQALSPTIVLVHGYAANKSEVLKYAVPFHERFAVVAFDLRNGGRSGKADTTFGLHEQYDLRAIIDWLERTKHPTTIVVMGNSMGGGTALIEAATDPRVDGLILDSTHAHFVDVIARKLVVEEHQPVSVPGTPAIVAGIWLRIGMNPMDSDPGNFIPALGDRPLLIIHGTDDAIDLPDRSATVNEAAARSAGVPVELAWCPGGQHGRLVDEGCPVDWARWSVAFVDRIAGAP